MLVCRPATFWCPPLDLVNSEITSWSWRREVGSRASLRCLQGYEAMFGNSKLVCGSRDGAGMWLVSEGAARGDHGIALACAPIQHFCPAWTPPNASVVNLSAGRDVGSVMEFACAPGFEQLNASTHPTVGGRVAVCDVDGAWKRPILKAALPHDFVCSLISPFCSHPASFALVGASLQGHDEPEVLEHGARLRHHDELRRLGDYAEFECVAGFMPLLGDTKAVCALDRSNDTRGSWMSANPLYAGQIDFQPLRCRLIENWCDPILPEYGYMTSLSNEWFLGSHAFFRCASGYEQVGGHAHLRCGYNVDRNGGAWWAPDSIEPGARILECAKIAGYCPVPEPTEAALLSLTDGTHLDSMLSLDCSFGFALDMPREVVPRLVCRPGPGDTGWWTTPDGAPLPVSAFVCRGIQNWCPPITVHNGAVEQVLGARRPNSTVTLVCNLGFELWLSTNALPNNSVLRGDAASSPSCQQTAFFCPAHIPAFTNIFGASRPMHYSGGEYFIDFQGERAYGSEAYLACNPAAEFNYSYGDDRVVCGYNADGTAGAWRSPRGMLAVPFHCYYFSTPHETRDTVWRKDDCLMHTQVNFSIPRQFYRTGSIIFWIKPAAWHQGLALIEGEHGDDKWQVMFVGDGLLNAQVAHAVGQVTIDLTKGGSRRIQEWYHVAFTWDLGVGLAGLGMVKLWVDGELAPPRYPTGPASPGEKEPGSHHLDHFTWVEPWSRIRLGGYFHSSMPGIFSKVRCYSRAVPEVEVNALRATEEPRCGFTNAACAVPYFINAYVSGVDNPGDARFALISSRPETRLRMTCDPGFVPSDGDEIIVCNVGGAWGRPDTSLAALRFKCCAIEGEWCPPLNITSPGAVMVGSAGSATGQCIAPTGSGNDDGMGISYVDCPEPHVAHGSVISRSDG